MSDSDDESQMKVETKSDKKKSKKRKAEVLEESIPTPAAAAASDDEDDSASTSSSTPATDVFDGLAIIAKPLASDKLTKKCLKLVKKAAKSKSLRRGVKEFVKAVRKGEKGVAILAGNITPIDVITHIPVLCEDNDIPYVFVPKKEELGAAGATKRPTSVVLVQNKKDADYKETYDKVKKAIEKLHNE